MEYVVFRFPKHVSRLFKRSDDRIDSILHAAVGIAGEAGEVLDAVKKTWVYGKELDRENLIEELGDILFYVQALALQLNIELPDVMEQNIKKLEKRYPDGYTDQAAIERVDKVI